MAKNSSKSNITLEAYVPLLVIFATIFIAAVALELRDESWNWPTFGQFFMGLFLTLFAMFKMFDQQAFRDAFQMYDLVAKKEPRYASAYPFIELFLGIMYLSETWIVITNILTFIVMSVGLVGITRALIKDKGFQCACLGGVIDLPLSMVSALENTLMALMALMMLVR